MKNAYTEQIKSVLYADHKTYKYILITALLAKACDTEVNPLALQAGAQLNGAYDARSLCHKVIVPFERNFLNNALGGSNEPFLNKPARFTHLSLNNAVRRGSDRETLKSLINILQNTTTPIIAKHYLCFALELLQLESIKLENIPTTNNVMDDVTLITIYKFIINFISESFEGETCVIVVGALEKLHYKQISEKYNVMVHKVNQSGKSSKEVGDIDVYDGMEYKYSIEIKDKDFTEHDVIHAFKKMINAKSHKGAFIYGPRAKYDKEKIDKCLDIFESKDFFTLFISVLSYSRVMLFSLKNLDFARFVDTIVEISAIINCKSTTKKWLNNTLEMAK